MQHILTVIIWLPLIIGSFITLVDFGKYSKYIALTTACISLMLVTIVFISFDNTSYNMQFIERYDWIINLNSQYFLGIDGISLNLLMLNNFITLLVIITGINSKDRISLYYGLFLIMSGLINGCFCALDAILFYIFFEAMLIPMYLIIGIWGGKNRVYAAIKFFLYTVLGSLLMLLALLYLHQQSNSFVIKDFYLLPLTLNEQLCLFGAFFMAFAVKIPLWPLHTWLPDAHPEAPTGGSVVLAAVTLKLGIYGILRFMLPIVPDAARCLSNLMATLSLISIIYAGFIAAMQTDMKKWVAYSSISHMGLVTLGVFLLVNGNFSSKGIEGALVQMISHGFVSAALFFAVGMLYERTHSKNIADHAGLAKKMPLFATLLLVFAMANIGLPGTSGFVGEFMILMTAVESNIFIAILAASTVVISAGYTLWCYRQIMFGSAVKPINDLPTLSFIEQTILVILLIAVILVGLYPNIILNNMHSSVEQLISTLSV